MARFFEAFAGQAVDAGRELGELFFPAVCACCGAYGRQLLGAKTLCRRCDLLLRQSLLNVHRPHLRFASLPVVSAGIYEYELARAILNFKEGGRTDLLSYFAPALNRCLMDLCSGWQGSSPKIWLVPVPSTRSSIYRRTFAPASLLAGELVKQTRINPPLSGTSFVRLEALQKRSAWNSKHSTGQKQLGVRGRLARAQSSLKLAKPPGAVLGLSYDLTNLPCILLDDVSTSGASLLAASQLLEDAGARVLGACTLASVPQRNQR